MSTSVTRSNMKVAALIVLSLAVLSQGASTGPRRLRTPVDRSGKVYQGIPGLDGEFPYVVSITGSVGTFCAGAIIDLNWVLTTARDTEGSTYWTIDAGAVNRLRPGVGHQKLTSVTRIPHRSWTTAIPNLNNIALLQTETPFALSTYVQPLKLPALSEEGSSFDGQHGVITGWGSTTSSGSASEFLNFADVVVLDNVNCVPHFPYVNDDHICTLGDDISGYAGACLGDEGAPLAIPTTVTTPGYASYKLLGIFSENLGCAIGKPDVFVRVTEYLYWIEENSHILVDPVPPTK